MTNTIYVANRDDNTVSIIDGNNNTNIKNIPVGKVPWAIGVPAQISNNTHNKAYVVNTADNTVSINDDTKNTNIRNITVGYETTAIGVDPDAEKIYYQLW